MKALVRSILLVAILIPFTANAAPAKKPGKKKGHRSKVVVVETHKHHVVYTSNRVAPNHIASNRAMRRIVFDLELAHGPMRKLDIVQRASANRYFTVRQARALLSEFRSQKVRLEALKVLRTRIVDRRNFRKLVREFDGHKARKSAATMLASL